MQRVRAEAPGAKAHAAVLLVDQADFGVAPTQPGSIRLGDARRAWPVFRPSPMLFQAVDLDRQTSEERHQEIHLQTKCPHWYPVCKKTSQIRIAQNDSVQQPFVGANG